METTITIPPYVIPLKQAVATLAAVCDGAQTEDARGFNGSDAPFGHRLAALPLDLWDDRMAREAWLCLRKYKAQLANHGIRYDTLPVPPEVEVGDARQDARRALRGVDGRVIKLSTDGRFAIMFPYDARLVAECRAIPGRQWDPPTKSNLVPRSSAAKLAAFARRHRFTIEPDALEVIEQTEESVDEPGVFAGVDTDGTEFRITFDFDEQKVNMLKARVPGRVWDKVRKWWRVRADPVTAQALKDWATEVRIAISGPASQLIDRLNGEMKVRLEASTSASAELDMQGFGLEPYPFQKAGILYAQRVKRAYLGDEMGLGKTVQALGLIWIQALYPAVIVVPASVKLNWLREAKRCLPGQKCMVADSSTTAGQLAWADVVITNYDQLRVEGKGKGTKPLGLLERLIALDPAIVVFDEAHYLKNSKTIRARAAMLLVKGREWRLMLSGTPFTNRPSEGVSQLRILGRLNDVGGYTQYTRRYCSAFQSRYSYNSNGHGHLTELNERLRAVCLVRRRKSDVLKELPEKQRSVVPVELSNRAEYDRAEADLIAWLQSQPLPKDIKDRKVAAALRAEHLVRLSALKQLAARGKVAWVKKWVADFLGTEKLILFGHHKEIVNGLAREFGAPKITGETPIPERQAAVDRFQSDDDTRLIVCNIKAAGVGLTLTAASNVAFVELAWTPADHQQAEDRAHRIGQTADSVNAWYLLGERSIDEDNFDLLQEKAKVVSAATDGVEADMGASVVDALTERLRSRA